MSGKQAHWVIDRMEGKIAVLERDDGWKAEVPRAALPKGSREGSVLLVTAGPGGEPDWKTAALDVTERKKRVSRAMKVLGKLKKNDPGGDIVIP